MRTITINRETFVQIMNDADLWEDCTVAITEDTVTFIRATQRDMYRLFAAAGLLLDQSDAMELADRVSAFYAPSQMRLEGVTVQVPADGDGSVQNLNNGDFLATNLRGVKREFEDQQTAWDYARNVV